MGGQVSASETFPQRSVKETLQFFSGRIPKRFQGQHNGSADQEYTDHVWCSDITYIPVRRGFLYLVAIMDWATRKILALRLSNTLDNLLDQDFSAAGPNQKWAGDISYIWTGEGWLYLAVILELYSRRVIGWAVSNRMKRDLAIRALDMTVALRQPPKGCIHNTDRGSHYCSNEYQKRLSKHGFKVSMSGKGNCYDSSMVETFFKSIKTELS